MPKKFKIGDEEYQVDTLTDEAKEIFSKVNFTTQKLEELKNTQAIMQRAKNSYVDSLKKEMLSAKAGLILD